MAAEYSRTTRAIQKNRRSAVRHQVRAFSRSYESGLLLALWMLVSFIASMGLRMFIAIAKQLRKRNARMVLFAPQAQVNQVFQTVLLRDIMPIVADEAEAVRFASS